MQPREIVQRTLEYRSPERVAATLPEPYWHDICHVGYHLAGFTPPGARWVASRQEFVDEWGNTWARMDASSKGEVARGVLERWDGPGPPALARPGQPGPLRPGARPLCRSGQRPVPRRRPARLSL